MKIINGIKEIKGIMLVILLPVGILLFYTASYVSGFVEKIYSEGVYRLIGQGLSLIIGIIPFSVAEIIVIAFSIYILYRIFFLIYSLIDRKRNGKQAFKIFIRDFFIVVSVLYFSFVLLWGLNYQRDSFSKIASFDTRPVTIKELADVCEDLINRSNQLRAQVNEDGKGVMHLKDGRSYALKNAYKGYDEAAKVYSVLGGKFGRPKGVLLSKGMSLLGLGGVYFPFTGEPNVNMDTPDTMIPMDICHEMAHQRGFAREDEANYIGYVTCTFHPDADFKYCGYLAAMVYAMNALYDHDKDRFSQLKSKYSEGVKRDLSARKVYWKSYEGTLNNVSSDINNTYLKANMQKEGISSYGRMVDLLIFEYRMKNQSKQ